ncbi:MAG: prephenate dehydrogenase, partial [Micromonosporaceae bacterium]
MLTVSVLGLGLIGGSLLRALSAAGYPTVGYDAAPGTRTAAADAGYPVAGSVAGAVAEADLVVLAVPLPAVAGVLDELAGYRGLLSDVTSVKAPVSALVAARLPEARYVGGHPMAGKETSGFAASDPALFTGCAWALCLEPVGAQRPGASLGDWLTVAELVTQLGARVVPATPYDHDRAVAQVSHLPHIVAAALAAATAADA